MSSATGERRGPGERLRALDAGRALAVVAMVFGHTCDALLSPAARATPPALAYWQARGLTAPLFMIISGWAVTLSMCRARARGTEVVGARLARVGLLLAFGYLLRLPGWDVQALLSGDLPIWEHLLAFDALHVIAVGLLGAVVVLSLVRGRVAQGLTFLLLAALAVAMGLRSLSPLPTTLPALAFSQALGGTSTFPTFPWVAYFFLGATIPLIAGDVRVRVAAGLAAVLVYLAASAWWSGFAHMPPAHPVLVSFRTGAVLLALAACEVIPARVAARLSPLARSSLGVYVIHVPLVYGWYSLEGLAQRVGPRLPFHQTALVALAVLAFSFAAERALKRAGAGATAAARAWRARFALRADALG